MARLGFIHGKLDIKMLTLYVLSHVAGPIDFATLTDLVMCDDGVDYFQFAEGVSELLDSGHVEKNDADYYLITEKGRRGSSDLESSLSSVVRQRCDRRLVPLNAALKRRAQVHSEVTPLENGGATVSLALDDDSGPLFTLTLMAGSMEDGEKIADQFSSHPDRIFNGILGVLLSDHS